MSLTYHDMEKFKSYSEMIDAFIEDCTQDGLVIPDSHWIHVAQREAAALKAQSPEADKVAMGRFLEERRQRRAELS